MWHFSRGAGIAHIAMTAGLNSIDIFKVRENSGMATFTTFGVLNDGIQRFPTCVLDFNRGIAFTYEK
jgi:hypothetical protein